MNVLFVCKSNICLSPAAAYLLQKLLVEEGVHSINVSSAGCLKKTEGKKYHPKVMYILKQLGCDISDLRAVTVSKKELSDFSYIVAMDREVFNELTENLANEYKEKIYLFTNIYYSTSPSSIENTIQSENYLIALRQINRLCKQWLEYFKTEL